MPLNRESEGATVNYYRYVKWRGPKTNRLQYSSRLLQRVAYVVKIKINAFFKEQ